MITRDITCSSDNWITKVNLRKVAFWTLVFLVTIWGMAPILDLPREAEVDQPICNAWVLAGDGAKWLAMFPMAGYRDLASYPMWGYSLLLLVFDSVTAVVIFQSLVGALAMAALMVRLNTLVPHLRRVTTMLFIFAIPWLSFMAYAYQAPMSWAFMIMGLVVLDVAIRRNGVRWAITAGVLFGFGQNFRSELVLVPSAMLITCFVLKRLRLLVCWPLKPLVICFVTAISLQIPWALNCYYNEGRLSLSESNLGHVLFRGLGEIPANPWGIEDSDPFAAQTVRQADLTCSSLSFCGGDFLKQKFFECVRQKPAAYRECILNRIRCAVFTSFACIPMSATPAEKQVLQQIRIRELWRWEKCSSKITTIASSAGVSVSTFKIAANKMYELAVCGLGLAVGLMGIVGFGLAMGTAPFRLNDPIILCLCIAVLCRIAITVALHGGGHYMTSVYLCYLPFAANTLSALLRWKRRHQLVEHV